MGKCSINMNTPHLAHFFVTLFLMILSWYAGIYFSTAPSDRTDELRLKPSGYTFINPLLDYQQPSTPLVRREVREMEEAITLAVSESIDSNSIRGASVYYRDLNNGPWLFINDELFFTPASLLKVPLMIAYFKIAESDPASLQQVITYTEPLPNVPSQVLINPEQEIPLGASYTVMELIEKMITQSDNVATLLLQKNIDLEIQKKIYNDFDIPLPSTEDPRLPYMSTQVYSGFLRILYNATYLNRDYSEKALELLSRSSFTKGLEAGIPESVTLSNKFGVYTKNSEDSPPEHQLHDCGIVYDKKTYAICVMTLGSDLQAQAKLIGDISNIVYTNNRR